MFSADEIDIDDLKEEQQEVADIIGFDNYRQLMKYFAGTTIYIPIADKLGIRDILSKFPYEVSGGQKQRCACARALINEPKLILADEPTGALDSKSSRLLLETMSDINKKMQATILMVTHDPFSASFCKRILFLKDGKIFNEIFRGEKSRKDFFNEILDILTLLGGEVGNVR